MQRSFLSARVGPILGIVGSSIVLIYYFFLPLNSLVSEWDGTPWQGYIDPMVVLVLLAALVVLILSVVALFLPHSPVPGGLSLLAACVGLLAQLYILLASLMNVGITLTTFFPRLFSFSVSGFFFFLWYSLAPLLGFMLSGVGIVFAAILGERQAREGVERRQSNLRKVDEKEKVWSIERRHVLAMIAGVLLYSVLSNLFILWEGPGRNFITVYPAVVIVLYFGVAYGPLVGLVTGGMGSFLNYAIGAFAHVPYWILSNYGLLNSVPLNSSHPHTYWPLVAGDAFIGLMAGLPLFGAAGRDKTIRSLLAVIMSSALSIIVGYSLEVVLYQSGQPVEMTLLSIQGTFTYESVPTLLVVVLLLPLSLLLFPARTTRGRERQALL